MTDNLPARQSKTPVRAGPPTANNPPRTEYVYVQNSGSTGGRRFNYQNNWVHRTLAKEPQHVPVPNGVPSFLGNAKIVGYAWLASMIIIGFDEWHNNHILPRPVRFWYGSVVFGLLALGSMVPPATPLMNALAIGYTIMLLWQFFNGSGQFTRG